MSRRGFGRRRTVLQLGDDNKQATFGFGYKPAPDRSREASALGALDMMMGYEDSDEEVEQANSNANNRDQGPGRKKQKFVASSELLEPAIPEVASTSQGHAETSNGHSVSPDTTKPKDEIDTKVMDFLAELDAFDGPDTTSGDGGEGIDGQPLAATPPHLPDDETTPSNSSGDELTPPAEPQTDWQQCLDDGTQCYYYWHAVSNEVTWEIPADYSQYLLRYKEYEDQLAKYEHDLASQPRHRRRRKKKKKRKKAEPPPEPSQSIGPELPESTNQSEPVFEGPSFPMPPLPPLPPANDAPQQPESSQMIGPLPPPPPPPPEEDDKSQPIGPELPSSSSEQPQEATNQEQDDNSSLGEDVDEYIHRKLEEPVFTHYEYVNKKYEGPQPEVPAVPPATASNYDDDDDDLELDIDDIDRQLEQALERKQAELQSREVDSTPMKRPLEDPVVQNSPSKRLKLDENDANVESVSGPQSNLKAAIKTRLSDMAEVTELCSLVTDKLEFLDVARSGLTRLQVLLVEIQTRLEDWQEGGLSTDVFLRRLRAASHTLAQYELSAAPPGWSCYWDSKFRRYFYENEVTEDTQWDYPTPEDPQPDEPESRADPAPPPPPPPPPVMSEPLPPPPSPPKIVTPAIIHHRPPKPPPEPEPMPEPAPPSEAEPSTATETEDQKADPGALVSEGYSFGPMFQVAPPPPPPSEDKDPESTTDPAKETTTEVLPTVSSNQDDDQSRSPISMETEEPDPTSQAEADAVATCERPSHIQASPMLTAQSNGSETNGGEETKVDVAMETESEATTSAVSQPDPEEPGPSSSQPSLDTVAETPAPAIEGGSSQEGTASKGGSTPSVKEKKKKKEKSMKGGGLSMKKKNVTGLVAKWQSVQKEVEKEMAHQKKIAKIVESEIASLNS